MRRPILFSLICTLLLAAGSNHVFASEHGDRHRHKGKSEYRYSKKHNNKHRHSHRKHYRQHKHRRSNDAAIFIGGAIVGAALNHHYNDQRHKHGYRSSNRYSYVSDRRGDCFRVEYEGRREIWYSVPRRQCRIY